LCVWEARLALDVFAAPAGERAFYFVDIRDDLFQNRPERGASLQALVDVVAVETDDLRRRGSDLNPLGPAETDDHQSAYFVPSSAVASDPLLTSYTPTSAVGLFGSGSAGIVCQVELLFVNGSSGTLRR
jgi:hypothetical protein